MKSFYSALITSLIIVIIAYNIFPSLNDFLTSFYKEENLTISRYDSGLLFIISLGLIPFYLLSINRLLRDIGSKAILLGTAVPLLSALTFTLARFAYLTHALIMASRNAERYSLGPDIISELYIDPDFSLYFSIGIISGALLAIPALRFWGFAKNYRSP